MTVYPDAEEFIQQRLCRNACGERIGRHSPQSRHASAANRRCSRLPLLPYQLDGIAFAAGAGRAILADDMGLGKTIKGSALRNSWPARRRSARVLVICPASLKSQWRSEIQRFCDRTCNSSAAPPAERPTQ